MTLRWGVEAWRSTTPTTVEPTEVEDEIYLTLIHSQLGSVFINLASGVVGDIDEDIEG